MIKSSLCTREIFALAVRIYRGHTYIPRLVNPSPINPGCPAFSNCCAEESSITSRLVDSLVATWPVPSRSNHAVIRWKLHVTIVGLRVHFKVAVGLAGGRYALLRTVGCGRTDDTDDNCLPAAALVVCSRRGWGTWVVGARDDVARLAPAAAGCLDLGGWPEATVRLRLEPGPTKLEAKSKSSSSRLLTIYL